MPIPNDTPTYYPVRCPFCRQEGERWTEEEYQELVCKWHQMELKYGIPIECFLTRGSARAGMSTDCRYPSVGPAVVNANSAPGKHSTINKVEAAWATALLTYDRPGKIVNDRNILPTGTCYGLPGGLQKGENRI